MEAIYRPFFIGLLVLMACLLFACLIRAVKGPRIADRIVSVNMIGTMVIVIISIASVMLHEGYLMDICLIYAMVSFLAVVAISKMYMGIYHEKQNEKEEEEHGTV